MKRFMVLGTVILLFAVAQAPGLEAGAAKSRLTIPPGMPLAGYADRLGRESLGEHDPLWVRCLYIDDGETAAYLVSVDLHHIPRALRDRVVEISGDFAPKETVFLSATNTHNGAGGMDKPIPQRWTSGRYHADMLEIVAQAIVAAMESARDQKRRATLGFATARQQSLSQNRFNREGPIDEQIGVIRVDDADGKAIALVTNFAARPDLVPTSNHYHISADFPGAYYRAMEELVGAECVAMYLSGAAFDQAPANPENNEGWDQIESVGRLLAKRAKEAANEMTFRDVKIQTRYHEAKLPATLANPILPESALFQALDLDGLELLFVPGELSVEIGLTLRQQALAAGKSTQFTVALANDDLGVFIAPERYGDPQYQTESGWFGRDVEAWLLAQADALSGNGDGTVAPLEVATVTAQSLNTGSSLSLSGPGYQRGFQRGALVIVDAALRYEDHVKAPVLAGTRRPNDPRWGLWPSLVDASPLALPALGIAARPMLRDLHADLLAEAEGFAAGLGLPLDAALLMQSGPVLPDVEAEAQAVATVSGTLVAVNGDRAGVDTIVAACNFDAPDADAPVITTVEPREGHNYVYVAFDWQLGALAGMNDAGIVLSLSPNPLLGEVEAAGVPAALLIQQELQFSSSFDDTAARLRASGRMRGYQVLLAGQTSKGWRVAVLAFGKSVSIREPENDLLLGLDPESSQGDDAALERYASVATVLGVETPLGVPELQKAMLAVPVDGAPAPWNTNTRFSMIFQPGKLAVQAAFPDESGAPGAYKEFRLKKAARDE